MVVLLAVLMVVSSGCSAPAENVLRFGLAAAPINLDPRFATDATSGRIGRLLFERLVEFDAAARPVPGIAAWQELSPTHYRFTLQGEHRFHDGAPLTAADVKATYDFVLDAKNASPHRATLDMIERIETVASGIIDFHLTKPDALFPGRLVIGIVSRSLAANSAVSRQVIGSGTFKFIAWPEEGRLLLQRIRDGQVFEFLEVKDPTVRALKLMRGELDMLQNDLPPELIAYLSKQPTVHVIKGNGSSFTYLGFNMEDSITKQLKVRQAIAHAIDRPAIIRYVLGGAARPANALLPPDHWAGNSRLTDYVYDARLARQLLQEAGYGAERPPTLVYKTSNDPFRIRLATIIQHQLGQAGINVELRSYDWGTFYGDIKAGRFQMFSLSWVGIKTPDIFHYVFHSGAIPPAGANRGRFASSEADKLIEQADQASDLAVQRELYWKLQAYLHQELPYVPLWYEDHVFVAKRNIQGYTIALDGNFDGLNHVATR